MSQRHFAGRRYSRKRSPFPAGVYEEQQVRKATSESRSILNPYADSMQFIYFIKQN